MPTTKRKEDKKWMKSEILDLMEERRKTIGDEEKYKELDKMMKKKMMKQKRYGLVHNAKKKKETHTPKANSCTRKYKS